MKILKDTPFEVAWLLWKARPGTTCLTLVVKGSFSIAHSGPCPIDPRQELLTGDLHHDDDVERSVRYESDFAHVKPRGECFVVGSCFAPGGRPVEMELAAFKIGPTLKKMAIIGDRYFKGLLSGQSKPVPFTEIPLCWERAFGGKSSKTNPVGEGLAKAIVNGKAVIRLPNIEDPERLIQGKRDRPLPIGSFPIPRTWHARTRLTGSYNSKWVDDRWPWLPEDFDLAYHNAAPSDQRIAGFYRGNEEISLINLHPEYPKIRCHLPGLRANAFLRDAKRGVLRPLTPELDTITVDTELKKVLCLWRAVTTVPSESLEEFSHLFVVHEEIGSKRMIDNYRDWFDRRLEEEEAEAKKFEPEPISEDAQVSASATMTPPPSERETESGGRRVRSSFQYEPSALLRRPGALPEPVSLDSPVLAPLATSAFDEESSWIDIVLDESQELPEIPEPARVEPPRQVEAPELAEPHFEPTITFDEHLAKKAAELFDTEQKADAPPERAVAKTMVLQTQDDEPERRVAKTQVLSTMDDEPQRQLAKTHKVSPMDDESTRQLAKTHKVSTVDDEPVRPIPKTKALPIQEPSEEIEYESLLLRVGDDTGEDSFLMRSDWVSVAPLEDLESDDGGWSAPEASLLMLAEEAAFLVEEEEEEDHDATAYMSTTEVASALQRGKRAVTELLSQDMEGSTTLRFIEAFSDEHALDELTQIQAIPKIEMPPPIAREKVAPPPRPPLPIAISEDGPPRPFATTRERMEEESALFISPSELATALGGDEFRTIEEPREETPEPERTKEEQQQLRAKVMAAIESESDCVGWDLADADLSGLDLSGGDFGKSLLTRANLSGATLDDANFSEAVLDYTTLTGASLVRTNLTRASLIKADGAELLFEETLLDGADASWGCFPRARFIGCACTKTELIGADLLGARFEGTTLDRADLSRAVLDDAFFVESSLVETDISEEASVRRAKLEGCDLSQLRASEGSDFSAANFRGAKISGGRFGGSKLEGANFSFAELDGADFSETILTRATMLGCRMRGARFDGAVLLDATLGKSDLQGARFEGATLLRTDLRGCNLHGAEFLDATTLDTKLELANLTGTKLE